MRAKSAQAQQGSSRQQQHYIAHMIICWRLDHGQCHSDQIIVFMRFPEIAMESHGDSKRMKKSRSDRTAINNQPDEIIATGSRTAANNNYHQATTIIPNWSPSVEARVQVFRALMRFAQLYRLSIDDTDVITKDSVLLISLVNLFTQELFSTRQSSTTNQQLPVRARLDQIVLDTMRKHLKGRLLEIIMPPSTPSTITNDAP